VNEKRKRLLLVSALASLAVVACIFAGTRSEKSIDNTFTAASVGIGIVENDTLMETSANTVSFIESNNQYTATKKVSIENIGGDGNNASVFVRVCIFPRFIVKNETTQVATSTGAFPASITGNTFTMGGVTFTLNEKWTDYWTYSNGYFYYIGGDPSGVLAYGSTTESLLESVSVSKTFYDEYIADGRLLRVVVLADSIQTVGKAVENRWGSGSGLESNDVERPTESSSESSATQSKARARTYSDSNASGSAIITNYQEAQIQNMI
jgi:hypothetical protein